MYWNGLGDPFPLCPTLRTCQSNRQFVALLLFHKLIIIINNIFAQCVLTRIVKLQFTPVL